MKICSTFVKVIYKIRLVSFSDTVYKQVLLEIMLTEYIKRCCRCATDDDELFK